VGTASSAQLKVLLSGIELPAEKPALLEYAVRQRAEPQLIDALRSLPEGEYDSLDEVAEKLVRAQPPRVPVTPPLPRAESGQPPGGEAYTDLHPDTGQVRDLDKAPEN
jgi:hypothetical protein